MSAKSMQKVLESGNLKTYMDPRLTQAIRHPIREHLLACFNEEITSATRIGEALGLEVSAFYKHVQLLQDLGFIEEVDGAEIPGLRRRGNKERFFRARETLLWDAEATEAFPRHFKNDLLASHLVSIWDEASRAVRAGTFVMNGESHLTWLPGIFDGIGWREAIAVVEGALYRLMEVQKHSAERVARSGQPGFTATFAMLGFGTPQSGFAGS